MRTQTLLKWLGGYFYTILIILATLMLSSCSMYNNLTDSEHIRRAKIQKQIDVLQANYYYTLDSLYIEYYKEDICDKKIK